MFCLLLSTVIVALWITRVLSHYKYINALVAAKSVSAFLAHLIFLLYIYYIFMNIIALHQC